MLWKSRRDSRSLIRAGFIEMWVWDVLNQRVELELEKECGKTFYTGSRQEGRSA